MENKIFKKEIPEGVVEQLQSYYEDYRAKQDLIMMLFEMHKNDTDAVIIESKPFLAYEKKFAEAKVYYDTMMEEIRNNYVPKEYQKAQYNFGVNFETNEIEISLNE